MENGMPWWEIKGDVVGFGFGFGLGSGFWVLGLVLVLVTGKKVPCLFFGTILS